MKKLLRFLIILLLAQNALICQAQNRRDKKQQAKHLSEFETQTLADSLFPIPMPYNRWVDPAGQQIYFGDKELENHALDCALSPNGKWVAVEGRYSVLILSTENNEIVERITLKKFFRGENVMNTFSGITWRRTGEDYYLYWSVSGGGGKSYVIKASWNGHKLNFEKTFDFLAEAPASTALPNEIVVTAENGKSVLYVVLNGNNLLVKLNEQTGEPIWSAKTGVAPYGVIKAAGKVYITNWAGSVPDKTDRNVAGVPWGSAKVDLQTGATR
ncbi:MAG: YncE family protein, partial [Mariniphaga sp.]